MSHNPFGSAKGTVKITEELLVNTVTTTSGVWNYLLILLLSLLLPQKELTVEDGPSSEYDLDLRSRKIKKITCLGMVSVSVLARIHSSDCMHTVLPLPLIGCTHYYPPYNYSTCFILTVAKIAVSKLSLQRH